MSATVAGCITGSHDRMVAREQLPLFARRNDPVLYRLAADREPVERNKHEE